MKKKGFAPEQIITMLREAEVVLSKGARPSRSSESSVSRSRHTTAGEESTTPSGRTVPWGINRLRQRRLCPAANI